MLTWLQKYQQALIVTVLFVTITAFVWLYNPASDMRALAGESVGKLYGRNVSLDNFRKMVRLFELARELQMYEHLMALVGPQNPALEPEAAFAYHTMILREEAKKLQLEPSQEEMVAALQAIPAFQTNGQFDPAKMNMFLQDSLASRGFSQSQLDDLIRDSLRLEKLREMMGATVPPPVVEAKRYFDLGNQRSLVEIVQFNQADFAKDYQPTEEEIQQHYEQNKLKYNTSEKRRVEYVVFKLPAEEKPEAEETGAAEGDAAATAADPAKAEESKEPTAEERIEDLKKLQELANKATDFVIAISDSEDPEMFKKKAQELGLEVQSTEKYEANGFPQGLMPLGANAFRAAQQLTPEIPVSDPVQNKEEFSVLYLAEVEPSVPMTLEQAKPQVIQELKERKATEAMNARVDEVRSAIEEAMKSGKSFADAAKAQDVNVVTLPPFRLNEPPRDQENMQTIGMAALNLPVGWVSQKEEIPGGALLIHVKQREEASAELWESEKESNLTQLHQAMQEQFLQNWLTTIRRAELKMTAGQKAAAEA